MDTTFGRHPVIRSLDEFLAAFFDHALALPKLADLLGMTYTALLAFVARPEIRQAINAARDRRDHLYADDGRQLMDEADHDLAHLRALDPDRTTRASTPRSRTREPSPAHPLHTLQPLRAPRPGTTPSPLPTPTDDAHAHPPCAPALVPLESPPSPAPSPSSTPAPTPDPSPDPLDTPPRPIDPDILRILQQLRYRRASPSSIKATLARLLTATPAASTAHDRPLGHSTTSPLPRARSPSTPLAARSPPLKERAQSASCADLHI